MTQPRTPEPVMTQATVRPSDDEAAGSLPAARVEDVSADARVTTTPARGRSSARWILALVGVLIVAGGTALIVSLAGGQPAASSAIGWMPATTTSYSEVRLDLPGDQRQKLAAFLAHFPGFKDQSQIEPKLTDVLDRIVRAASRDTQTWATDIQPWFGGQLAIAMGTVGDSGADASTLGMMGAERSLGAVTITDRAKAIEWLLKSSATAGTTLTRSTYGSADLFTTAEADGARVQGAIAVTDRAMLVGLVGPVKAAVDSNGAGTLGQNAEIKAALATVSQDYVAIGVTRTRAQIEAMVKQMSAVAGGALDDTRIDETLVEMVPPWSASTARFENDAVVARSAGPSWTIGVETSNRASQLLGHVPAKTILYYDAHDVGPTIKALVEKFRGLPETKATFEQVDQALSLLGGFDAVVSWWGDAALVVSPLSDGTLGGGLVIKPRDAAAAQRLLTTIDGFLAFAGSSQGLTTRTEDHNGTRITILDASGAPGMAAGDLPPGYKAELAWATNADVTVIGYGAAFVKEVLDAGPGSSLADDPRFKDLLARVGAEHISAGFVDLGGIRALLEPLAQGMAPSEAWTNYTTEIKPYLEHLDAVIQSVRKDQGLDVGSGFITVR